MIPLSTHPALGRRRGAFEPMADADKLAVHLRHLLILDPNAVYYEPLNSDSTIVYYKSPHAKPAPPGGCCRLVLDSVGKHRRIDLVGYRPTAAARS